MKKLCTFFLALTASVGMSWAMQIYIDVPEQDLLTLEVEPSDDIAVVKDKIQDKTSILVASQTLYFNSTLLEDDKALADYNIQKESTLTLVISGGEEEEGDAIVINTNEALSGYTKETITITCQNSGDAQGFKLSGSYTASISNSDASKHIEKIELVPGFFEYNHNKVRANGVEPTSSGEELITFLNVNSNEVTLSSSELIQIEKVKITLGDGAPIVYTVALKDGTVNADKVTLSATEAEENTTITVTPDTEYEITAFKATYNTTEEAASTLDSVTGVYSFTMPAANVTIEATIAAKPAPEGDIFENFTATDGSGGYIVDESHSKLVDGKYRETEWTKWCTDIYFKSVPTGESGDPCWWIDFEASNPLNLTGYILTTGNDNADWNRYGRNPKDWVIKAKLNADDAWTTIATVTNNTTMKDEKFKDYIFSLNQSGTYKYFRFEVLATQGSETLQLCELRLIGSVYMPFPTDESGAYVLSDADEWNLFAGLVNTGYEDFEGKNVVQTADFTVSTMAGSSDEHAFRGHYESRNGAALTFNYTDDGDEDFCAPFRFIDGASFEGLQVKGTIVKYKKKNAAGFAGKALGENTFTNCRSSVDIQADTDGDGSHGGFVGDLRGGTCSFSNCVFDGKMRGINGATSRTYNWGGLVSWVASGCTANFENCLFIPSEINISNLTETDTYARKAENGKVNVTNCYYTEQMGIARGTKAYALTADENISVENAGQKGVRFGSALYAGNGEELTLRLSNTAGYNAYKANEEDLIVSEGICTYTMPNADVLITGCQKKLVTSIWNDPLIRTIALNGCDEAPKSFTEKNVTVTVGGSCTTSFRERNIMVANELDDKGTIKFSAPVNITSIYIKAETIAWNTPSEGWSVTGSKGDFTAFWCSTPAKSVVLAAVPDDNDIYILDISSIVFTLESGDGEIRYTVTGFDGNDDDAPHGITVEVTDPANGYTVKYGESRDDINLDASPEYSGYSKHTVYFQISADGYWTVTDSAVVNIEPAGSKVIFETDFEEEDCLDGWKLVMENNDEDYFGRKNLEEFARTGEYLLAMNSAQTAPNEDQYIITPEFHANYLKMAFYARSFYEASNLCEHFKFGYSTTDNNFESFTWGDDIKVNTKYYKKYEYTAPAGAKYIAIKLTTPRRNKNLYIDDLTISGVSYTAKLEDNTKDAANWSITPVSALTYGVAAGETVTLNYNGTNVVDTVIISSGVLATRTSNNTWTFVKSDEDETISVEYKESSPTAIDEVSQEPIAKSQKLIKDGQIYIIRDGKTYTVTGQQVR